MGSRRPPAKLSFGGAVDASRAGALAAQIEQDQQVVSAIALTCLATCADVQVVATGGDPPYGFVWSDESTDPCVNWCGGRIAVRESAVKGRARSEWPTATGPNKARRWIEDSYPG